MSDSEKSHNFVCIKCGKCCTWSGYVIITDAEADQIAEFLNLDAKTFIAKFAKLTSSRKNLSLIEKDNGECIFFDSENHLCKIYEVRPKQCRNFPLKWNFPDWQNECKGRFE